VLLVIWLLDRGLALDEFSWPELCRLLVVHMGDALCRRVDLGDGQRAAHWAGAAYLGAVRCGASSIFQVFLQAQSVLKSTSCMQPACVVHKACVFH
jgi:hypothetical protein